VDKHEGPGDTWGMRAFLALSLVAAAVASAFACSSSETESTPAPVEDAAADAEDAATVEPVDAAPPPCKLPSGLGTGRKACDDCLLKSCCIVINTCFDDKKCEDLNDCINECGSMLGFGDAGAQCVRGCNKDVEESVSTKVLDLLTCQSERCGTDCK
jgi:hypothetical protein